MQLPGAAIPSDASSELYRLLSIQALVVFAIGFVVFFLVWRSRLFSTNGVTVFGRTVSLNSWRRTLFPPIEDAPTESLTLTVIRIGFGILWIIDALLQINPHMPNDMIKSVIQPQVVQEPSFVAWLLRGALDIWQYDPVASNAALIWAQGSIGALYLLGSRRQIRIIAAYSSIIWGIVIWIFGEGVGMILSAGNSFILGAPGAAFYYIIAGGLLLIADPVTISEKFRHRSRRAIGGFWILMALLQVAPFEGFWSGSNLTDLFQKINSLPRPSFIASPASFISQATASHPALWNAVFVALMLLIGMGIFFFAESKGYIYASIIILIAFWWIGTGFGFTVLSGIGSNSTLPLIILTIALLIVPAKTSSRFTRSTLYPGHPQALGICVAVAAMLVVILPLLVSLPNAARESAIYSAVNDGGGLTSLDQTALDFILTDQSGHTVSLSQFLGHTVILTFIDPVDYAQGPVISDEITQGVSHLGTLSKNVIMIAIDINPAIDTISSVQQFDAEHGLNRVKNWYFLTGSLSDLSLIWQDYAVTPSINPVGRISHPQVIYFINRAGTEMARSADTGVSTGRLGVSYSNLIASTTKLALGNG